MEMEFKLKKNGDRIKRGLPYKITAILKPYDDNQTPITDSKNAVKFKITSYRSYYEYCGFGHDFLYPNSGSRRCYKEDTSEEEKTAYPKNGIADVEFVLPSDKTSAKITVSIGI